MRLTLVVLLVAGFIPAHTALSLSRHNEHRYSREVPATSYLASPPGSGGYSAVSKTTIGIIKQTEENSYNGQFSYSFQADNGISVEVKGFQKSIGPNDEGQAMEGSYSYTAPDGTPVFVQWTADETGFHATTLNQPTNTFSG